MSENKETYQIVKLLENTSSTNDKLAILKANKDNEDLRLFFLYALSPELVYGIKKIPAKSYIDDFNASRSQSFKWGLSKLEYLANRTYTGNAGIDHLSLTLGSVSIEAANLIERVIKKDPNCGVSTTTVNKVWPNLIQEYPVALCERDGEKNRKKIELPAAAQTKEDAMRFNAIVDEKGIVEFRTRKGKTFTLSGQLENEFIQLGSERVYDGEMLVVDSFGNPLPRKIANGVLNKAIKGTISEKEAERIVVVLWDIIPLSLFWKRYSGEPYLSRFTCLSGIIEKLNSPKIRLVHNKFVKSWEEAEEIFKQHLDEGKEGIIVKDINSPWEDKRLKTQIKMKAEKDADLICVGTIPHSKNPKMIGSLTLETSCGQLRTNCGTGLTDKDRLKDPSEYIDKVIEIVYNEIIEKEGEKVKSLFLPVFKRVRHDKNIANSLKELN